MREFTNVPTPKEPQRLRKKLTLQQKLKRFVFAGLLGVTTGTVAVEADQRFTHGFFLDHVHSFFTDQRYREKVGESLASGEAVGDLGDLFRAAGDQSDSSESESATGEFIPTQYLSEKLPIVDEFLRNYFDFYEIRDVLSGREGDARRPVFIAHIDNPEIVDFN